MGDSRAQSAQQFHRSRRREISADRSMEMTPSGIPGMPEVRDVKSEAGRNQAWLEGWRSPRGEEERATGVPRDGSADPDVQSGSRQSARYACMAGRRERAVISGR